MPLRSISRDSSARSEHDISSGLAVVDYFVALRGEYASITGCSICIIEAYCSIYSLFMYGLLRLGCATVDGYVRVMCCGLCASANKKCIKSDCNPALFDQSNDCVRRTSSY